MLTGVGKVLKLATGCTFVHIWFTKTKTNKEVKELCK